MSHCIVYHKKSFLGFCYIFINYPINLSLQGAGTGLFISQTVYQTVYLCLVMSVCLSIYLLMSIYLSINLSHCKKKYCWFNLKNEVTWLPYNFKFIELEKLSLRSLRRLI